MRQKPIHATGLASVFAAADIVWALGSVCALHQKSFSAHLLVQEYPPTPSDEDEAATSGVPTYFESTLFQAASSLGFKIKAISVQAKDFAGLPLPVLVQLPSEESTVKGTLGLALVTAAHGDQVVMFAAGQNEPVTLSCARLDAQLGMKTARTAHITKPLLTNAWLFAAQPASVVADSTLDPDRGSAGASPAGTTGSGAGNFSFKWFVPELLRHKTVWRDVLLASLALQLVTLATPLFTQAIIDKVIVHRTQSTLITIGVAMGMLTISPRARLVVAPS